MWFKKHCLIITVVAAVVLLISGIIGGAVYAQSPDDQSGQTSGEKSIMSRVATILGIDQTKLEDAFAQAQKEMRAEEQAARLAKLVSDGKITQEQSDAYQSWLDSKPDLPAGTGLEGDGGFRGGPRGMGMGPGGMGGPNGDQPPAPPTESSTSE